MLKSLLTRLASRKERSPGMISIKDHGIRLEDISPGAIRVIEELERAGFAAYLVGGGVRDLLLGGHPKDFDVATDATPEQTKRVFRSARIVGRRFRIVHVRMGREVLEVTTFRGSHSKTSAHSAASEEGMLLRDNVYGDIKSDALRRDFTMNALYYSPGKQTVTDFTTGLNDIADHLVRMIGDPTTRYQEDPVRMLRAVRLAAKLDFEIEAKTAAPIGQLGDLLKNIPSARLFDECLKLFMSGYAAVTYQELRRYGLFGQLFPGVEPILAEDDQYHQLISQAAINTDNRIHTGQRVTPAFIFAVILWPEVERQFNDLTANGLAAIPALHQVSQWVIGQQIQRVAIPKRFTMTIRDIWELQVRMPRRHGAQAYRALAHPKFRAAYDFLLLREGAGAELDGLGQWWTDFQTADEDTQATMVSQLPGQRSNNKSRSRRRKSNQRSSANSNSNHDAPSSGPDVN